MTNVDELRPIIADAAEEASRRTVRETFRLLGVDIRDQASVNEFRADLVYARRLRRLGDQAGRTAFRVMVGAIVAGTLVWLGDELLEALRDMKGTAPPE